VLEYISRNQQADAISPHIQNDSWLCQREKDDMDPNVAYKMMMEYFMEDDLDMAINVAKNLRDWLNKGGFAPREVPGFNFKRVLQTVLNFEHSRG
jgi:hypothetical protein